MVPTEPIRKTLYRVFESWLFVGRFFLRVLSVQRVDYDGGRGGIFGGGTWTLLARCGQRTDPATLLCTRQMDSCVSLVNGHHGEKDPVLDCWRTVLQHHLQPVILDEQLV